MSRSAGAERLAALALGVACAVAGPRGAFAGDAPPLGIPRPSEPASNPTTPAKIALGKKLFAEERLSKNGRVACATCHVATLAFTDGIATSRGVTRKPLSRNAPSLLNVAVSGPLFWDGRVASLEEQARIPILHADEMGLADEEEACRIVAEIPEYPPLFEAAFGDRTITLQRIARAIAAFERSLLAGDAPFDRWWAGDATAMSDAAQRGYRVFLGDGACAQCHTVRQSYALFTDNDFHNTGAGVGAGLDDLGRFVVTGRDEDRGAFRTPGLRNVELTAPYMHDGSLASLPAVIDFYAEGGRPNSHLSPLIHPLALDEGQRSDLLAFLKALTSPALPDLDTCERLLREGRTQEAYDAFLAELAARPADDRALLGLARSARALDGKRELLDAERRLRARIAEASPGHANDADPAVIALLLELARTAWALAAHEDAMAIARRDDALLALARIRRASGLHVEAAPLEAEILETADRADEALALLEPAEDAGLRILRAKLLYRRGWRGLSFSGGTDADRRDVAAAASALDALPRDRLDDEAMLLRATARHWTGDVEAARSAYLDAASRPGAEEKALRGLRNLLAGDLARYRNDLAAQRTLRPDSPAVLYLSAWEALETGDLDGAESALRRRLGVETEAAAGTHVLLARVERRRGNRAPALAQYAVALALDGRFPGLVAEYEQYVRERSLGSFADVDALVDEYRRFLDAGPDDPRFQAFTRNNAGFLLRDVAASWTSRGPARLHTFPDGAPPEAKRVLRTALAFYEEAAALLPQDVAELPFAERWLWAGVLNDLGLMLHYFPEIQDLARAEACYLQAFELTDGAYQDAYFYNLQFLYGFELDGRDELWLSLAERAKDAILREDPDAPTGFSPDPMKRTAARRDFERLTAKLRR